MQIQTVLKVGAALCIAFFGIEAARTSLHGPKAVPVPVAQQIHAQTPVQTPTDKAPFAFEGYQIRPLAQFAVRARVLGREDYRMDKEADLSPIDLALGWKQMADPAVYGPLNITQGGRWYRYSWKDQPPIALQEIIESSANMHMIPANAAVLQALKKAREGRFIQISGYLVEATNSQGWRWTSSLTRSDSGGGSCELVFVESALVE
ncbi:MAG: hypothetical protein M9929_09465 [Burkholderiaceae bacterium]|nr:hypothetical protein [Burkholderiaceae bacterium]